MPRARQETLLKEHLVSEVLPDIRRRMEERKAQLYSLAQVWRRQGLPSELLVNVYKYM